MSDPVRQVKTALGWETAPESALSLRDLHTLPPTFTPTRFIFLRTSHRDVATLSKQRRHEHVSCL